MFFFNPSWSTLHPTSPGHKPYTPNFTPQTPSSNEPPKPPKRACMRDGCGKSTTSFGAYQHLVAVHGTGEEGQAESDHLWAEACQLWPEDPACRGLAARKRTRSKADHSSPEEGSYWNATTLQSPRPNPRTCRRGGWQEAASSSSTDRLSIYQAFC